MATTTAQSFNYLIVSDLHLQEADLNPQGRLFYFDQEFTDFLRHYRKFYEGHRRWRLIIAGDFIEFYLRIHERPDPQDKLLRGVKLWKTDVEFFPGAERRKSVWKLDRIVRSHQLLFIALARFILEGNELYILRGNHDLEFFWPEVQIHFRVLLAQFHPVEVSYLEMKRIVEERVHFLPWFYWEHGLLFIEHGHQYDAYCSNAHNLYPVLPLNHEVLEMPLSGFVLRYFHARLHMDPAAMENINSIPKSFWYLIRQNLDRVLLVPIYLLIMIARTLGKARGSQPALDLPIREMEAKIRQEIKAAHGISDEALQSIERLAHLPILRSRWGTIRCFLLDLIFVWITALGIGVALLLNAATTMGWWIPLGVSLLLLLALGVVGKRRFATFNDHRNLREIARTIRDRLGCRYIVFGHSHDPDVHPLSDSRDHWYFNVGTWAPRSKEGQFVYLEILTELTGPSAHLMRWDRKREQPVELDLASYTQGSAEREAMLAGETSGLCKE